jgi:hypothetical protein
LSAASCFDRFDITEHLYGFLMRPAVRPYGSLIGRWRSIASSAGVTGMAAARGDPQREGSVTRHLWIAIIAGYWFVILLVTLMRIMLGG